MDNENELKTKTRFFFDNKFPVHIVRKDGRFYNGIILEHQGDLIILDDEKLGTMPIYFFEMRFIEKREVRV